jgi:uncharacterized membrane protein YeaQ/YmgE (transglycosylase-associated protein family)
MQMSFAGTGVARASTMWIVWALIIGLVVGAAAKLVLPGRDPGGILVTIGLGIAGALLAAWFGRAAGWYREAGQAPGFVASVVGAVVLLVIHRVARERPIL